MKRGHGRDQHGDRARDAHRRADEMAHRPHPTFDSENKNRPSVTNITISWAIHARASRICGCAAGRPSAFADPPPAECGQKTAAQRRPPRNQRQQALARTVHAGGPTRCGRPPAVAPLQRLPDMITILPTNKAQQARSQCVPRFIDAPRSSRKIAMGSLDARLRHSPQCARLQPPRLARIKWPGASLNYGTPQRQGLPIGEDTGNPGDAATW